MSEGQQPLVAVPPPESMELLRYREELAAKIGLPSPFGMGLMKQMAKDMVDSGMVPSHFANNPMAVYLAAMRGREMGLDPMESILETFWAAPGKKLGLYASKMLDILHRAGVTTKFIKEDKEGCEILFKPPAPHEPYHSKFYRQEAKDAGLIKTDSNWEKWGADMNRARCISRAWRALIGTFKGGSNMYIPEELADTESTTDTPTDDDRRRADTMKAQEEFKAEVKKGPVVDVKADPVKLYQIFVVSSTDSSLQKIDREKPQIHQDSTSLRAQALANEYALEYQVFEVSGATPVFVSKHSPPIPITRTAAPAQDPTPAATATPTPEDAKKKREPKADPKALTPEAEAMRARWDAMVKVLDPSPNAVAKTWKSRIHSFVCGYLGVNLKSLPAKASDWEEPISDLEALLAVDPDSFRAGPEECGKLRKRRRTGLDEFSAIKWPNQPIIAEKVVELANQWDHTAEHFSKWVEANAYDFFPESKDALAFLRLSLRTRESNRIAKLASNVGLSIHLIVKQMEDNHLETRLETASQDKILAAIAKMETEIKAKVKAEVAKKQEPAAPAQPAAVAPEKSADPGDDLFWDIE